MSAAVSVIVPARDAEATLPRTLACLARQRLDREYEVIVVDDGSRDRTRELAEQADGPVRVVVAGGAGPAGARNRGVADATGSALAFLDADCFPSEGWLAAGLGALERADLVQGHVLPDPSAEIGPFDRTLWITFEVGLYETANLFGRREVFDRVGGFEAPFEPELGVGHMGEDVLFGWRAKRLGATSSFCAGALAHHAVFRRGAAGYVAERRRLRYFPLLAREVPELREAFFWRRFFLSRRTAALDLALAGAAWATLRRSPLALAAALPYLRLVRRGPKVAAVDALADLVGLLELLRGSLRARSPLL